MGCNRELILLKCKNKCSFMTLPIIGTTIKSSVCSKYMKFQKTGGKIGIPKKNLVKFKIMGEKLEFVGFSLSSPVPNRFTN